jgi:hypothetical protein
MDLKDIKWDIVDWINLAKVRHQLHAPLNTTLNIQGP